MARSLQQIHIDKKNESNNSKCGIRNKTNFVIIGRNSTSGLRTRNVFTSRNSTIPFSYTSFSPSEKWKMGRVIFTLMISVNLLIRKIIKFYALTVQKAINYYWQRCFDFCKHFHEQFWIPVRWILYFFKIIMNEGSRVSNGLLLQHSL